MRRTSLTAWIGTVGLAAGAALAGGLALAGPAAAAPPADTAHPAATTRAEHDRIVAYWTPERMRTAKDGSLLVDADAAPSGQVDRGRGAVVPAARPDKPGKPGGGGSTPGAVGGALWTSGGQVVATTGKVFFTLASGNYVCSGSAVASGNESTVLTAGHCVAEAGRYAANFAFVPAYDDNVRPYGTWTASTLRATSQWLSSEDLNYDVAFATMNTLNGATLTDTVGGQGIAFNQARGEQMSSFGFPAATPYDGSELAYCSGVVVQDTYGGSSDQGMACDMTGGSSGGPWFTSFNGSTGTLNSLNSFKYTRIAKQYMWGPYFGTVAQQLYTAAAG